MRHSRMRPRRRLGVLCDAARSPPAVLGAPKPQKELGLACWGSRVEDNQGALVTAFRAPDLCLRPPQLQPRDDGVRGGDTSRPPTAWAAACAACAGEAPVRSCRSPHVGRSRAPPWAARTPGQRRAGAAPRGRSGGRPGRLPWGRPEPRQEIKAITGRGLGQMGRPPRSRARRAFTQSQRSPFGVSSWETGSDCSPQMPCNLSWEPPRGSWTWLRERT